MSLKNYSIIVVTPVYEDIEASHRLFKEIAVEFPDQVYIVAIDDGSVKQPLTAGGFENAEIEGVVLKLRRNVGHQRAISIGLGYAAEHMDTNQVVVVMDSDGEDLPSTIPQLLHALKAADTDVAVAQRKSRVETLKFKAFYFVYKRIFLLMTGRAISFGNFMALKSTAVKRLVSMEELSTHVAATVLASKLRSEKCNLDRGPRYAGQSKMNFVGLVLHGFRGLMVFAEDVLVRVGLACILVASASVFLSGVAVLLKVLGFSTPGWFSMALGILVLMLLQTSALALMTLMLTGAFRNGTPPGKQNYHDYVDKIIYSKQK